MTDFFPCVIIVTLVAMSIALFVSVIVHRRTWHCWRNPFSLQVSQSNCIVSSSSADVALTVGPKQGGFAWNEHSTGRHVTDVIPERAMNIAHSDVLN